MLRAQVDSFQLRFQRLERNADLSSKSRSVRSLITKFFFVVCLVVGTYHGFQITKEYLEYGVTAEALFYPIDPIIPPMVTLCVRNNFKPSLKCDLTCGGDAKLLFDSVFNIKESIVKIGITNDSKIVDLLNDSALDFLNSTTTTFAIYGSVCYAIDISKYHSVNRFTHLEARASEGQVMFYFQVNFPICKEIGHCQIFITKSDDYLLEVYGKFLFENDSAVYRYQKTTLNLLEPPFKTRCRNYEKQGMDNKKSQGFCITQCVFRNALLSGDKQIPGQVPVFAKDAKAMSSKNITISQSFRRSSECESKCSQIGCHLENYFVIEHSRLPVYKNLTSIQIMMPDRGELRVNYKAKIDIWEFFTLQ